MSNRGWGAGQYWRALSPFAPAIGLIAVQLVWFGMPMGAWIRGVVLGLLIALLAVGMALVYRANRVINFAQANLGFVPTSLAVGLIVFSGLPYLFGFSVGTDTLTAWYAGAEHEFAPQDVVFQAPPFFEGLEVLTAETIERARADGFGIWAWMDASTQETTEFYRELIARGIDGIIASRNSEAIAALTPTD